MGVGSTPTALRAGVWWYPSPSDDPRMLLNIQAIKLKQARLILASVVSPTCNSHMVQLPCKIH